MSEPIINLNAVRAIVARSERYGVVDGIDGTKPEDIIAVELAKTRGSIAQAGRALLALYSDFGSDAVNAVLAANVANKGPTTDASMSKVIAVASANPLSPPQ